MADEPVVVSKARPMKASNGVEDKTKPTISNVSDRANCYQKYNCLRRGEAYLKTIIHINDAIWVHKLFDEIGHLDLVT